MNALIDAVENVILLQLALHQVVCGTGDSTEELLHRLEMGQLQPPIDMVIDCNGVWSNIATKDLDIPTEQSLTLALQSLRDRLSCGGLRAIYWCDTRDMVAYGLTKGSVSRVILQKVMDQGKLVIAHEAKRNPAVRAQQVLGMTSESAAVAEGLRPGAEVSPSTDHQLAPARAVLPKSCAVVC